ncbi:MAG: hypothetical protein LBI61_02550 [Puniceicoccales bacterium]|nr:hypothetical protein [Puniceicoccales bacterium]
MERFCERLAASFKDGKLAGDSQSSCYEMTVTGKKLRRTVKLAPKEANFMLFGRDADGPSGKISDDMALASFFNVNVFARVGCACKVFKAKFADGEFAFSKRHGKWFLDDSTSNLEIESAQMGKFFKEIFSLEAAYACHPFNDGERPILSITLYGGKASERVNFFSFDDGECFVENSSADAYFSVDRADFTRVLETVKDLLKFRVFTILSCDDVSVAVPENGEHFDLHDLKNDGKWQFTHVANGELTVGEVSEKFVEALLKLLNETKSARIVQEAEADAGHAVLTVTIDGRSDDPEKFVFYSDGGQLFVGIEGQNVKFEIDNSFDASLLSALKTCATAVKGAAPRGDLL